MCVHGTQATGTGSFVETVFVCVCSSGWFYLPLLLLLRLVRQDTWMVGSREDLVLINSFCEGRHGTSQVTRVFLCLQKPEMARLLTLRHAGRI